MGQEHLGGAGWVCDSGEGTTFVAADVFDADDCRDFLLVEGPFIMADWIPAAWPGGVATPYSRTSARRRSSDRVLCQHWFVPGRLSYLLRWAVVLKRHQKAAASRSLDEGTAANG